MGDHGGIIVAVKFYRSREMVQSLLYSTDEGETWTTKNITGGPFTVYSLMTEPGENTTVFTLFGSEAGRHQWVVVKADFQKAFGKWWLAVDLMVTRPLIAHLSLYTRLKPTCDKKIKIMGLVYIINQQAFDYRARGPEL